MGLSRRSDDYWMVKMMQKMEEIFFLPCNHPDLELEGSDWISVKNLFGSY